MSSKTQSIARDLLPKLQFLMPTKHISQSQDSSGNPVILIAQSSPAAVGEDNLLVYITPMIDDIARTDALGLAQRVYAPNLIRLLEQKNATTTITTAALSLAAAVDQCAKSGVDLEIWAQADATNAVVDPSQFPAGSKLSDLSDPINPRIGSV
jgi:hypothetical protein